METMNDDQQFFDEYGFPLTFPEEILSRMKEQMTISRETYDRIHNYFDAASNLYARIPLRMLYKIYNSQNPPVSQEDFLDAAEIISHEQNFYTIVRPEVFHGDAAPSQPMDQELVAEHLYAVGEEDYYKLEAAQEGKPWYLPDRERFLAYADSSYTKKTPQLLELADALQRTQRKIHCPPMEIAEEIEMYLRMDSSLQSIVDESQRLGVRFQNQQKFREFLQLLLEVSHHTRRYSHRGHTPAELGLPRQSLEEVLQTVTYAAHYQDPLANLAAVPNGKIKNAPTVSGKPARNAPCPCGSGRKYKNCCGK